MNRRDAMKGGLAAGAAALATPAEGAATLASLPPGDLLLPYQQRALRARSVGGASLIVIEKSRRIGLTWGLAADAVLTAGATAPAGGQNYWYMGYDQEMAREFIDACAMWARAFNVAAEAADEELLEGDGEKVQAFRIRFSSGFKIVALPSVARALRGKQGVVCIDEAAFHGDLAEVLKSALALTMWGGQVVVVSTHNGVANPFNILLDEVRSGERRGQVLTITFEDALLDGLYERIALAARIKGRSILPKAEWIADIRGTYGADVEEELDCKPTAGAGSWLDPSALASCMHPDAGKPELYTGGLYYMGRDVARRRDLAVIHGYELVGDVLWMRDRWLGLRQRFSVQDAAAADMISKRRMVRYKIDQTGMGEKVVEDEQDRYGESRVIGELLTGPSRLDLAIALKDRVDNLRIRFCVDPALGADMRAIKKQGGVGGSVQIINADDEVHADEFWAAALACSAAATAHQPYAYLGVARGAEVERDGGALGRPGAARFGAHRGVW